MSYKLLQPSSKIPCSPAVSRTRCCWATRALFGTLEVRGKPGSESFIYGSSIDPVSSAPNAYTRITVQRKSGNTRRLRLRTKRCLMKKPNSTTQGEVDRCRLGTYQITLSESGSVRFCICAFFLVTTFFDIRTFVHKISGLKIENVMVGSCQFFQ